MQLIIQRLILFTIQMKSAFIFNFLLLIVLMQAQEHLINQISSKGEWLPQQKEPRTVPRYFICGAEMNKFKKIQTFPQVCYVNCRRHYSRGKRRCAWQNICSKKPDIHEWTRSNGIRFKMCHFQRWEDQYNLQEHGDWEWQGMKMCPQNQMVWGYQLKISDRNGVSGLLLQCRNPYNVAESSKVLVVDEVSQKQWKTQYSKSGYAMGFKIKRIDGSINGIDFELTPMPYIFSFDINYIYPKNLNVAPQMIDNIMVINKGKGKTRKVIQFTKQRQFQRTWMNEKGQLNGLTLQKYSSASLTTTSFKKQPGLEMGNSNENSNANTNTQGYKIIQRQQSLSKFQFGTVEKVVVSQKQRDEVQVAPCTKKVIQQIVYSTNADIPYIATIGYTNMVAVEMDSIFGKYQGVLSSNVETTIQDSIIC